MRWWDASVKTSRLDLGGQVYPWVKGFVQWEGEDIGVMLCGVGPHLGDIHICLSRAKGITSISKFHIIGVSDNGV